MRAVGASGARHRGDAMRRRRIVVGDDQHLRAVDAGVLQRAAAWLASPRITGQPFGLGFVRAAGLSVVMT